MRQVLPGWWGMSTVDSSDQDDPVRVTPVADPRFTLEHYEETSENAIVVYDPDNPDQWMRVDEKIAFDISDGWMA